MVAHGTLCLGSRGWGPGRHSRCLSVHCPCPPPVSQVSAVPAHGQARVTEPVRELGCRVPRALSCARGRWWRPGDEASGGGWGTGSSGTEGGPAGRVWEQRRTEATEGQDALGPAGCRPGSVHLRTTKPLQSWRGRSRCSRPSGAEPCLPPPTPGPSARPLTPGPRGPHCGTGAVQAGLGHRGKHARRYRHVQGMIRHPPPRSGLYPGHCSSCARPQPSAWSRVWQKQRRDLGGGRGDRQRGSVVSLSQRGPWGPDGTATGQGREEAHPGCSSPGDLGEVTWLP